MYTPRSFRNDNRSELHALMRQFSFATLFTHTGSDHFLTHIPFMIDASRGTNGTLIAHMAHANPHWRALSPDGPESVVVFLGPHAYISPAWYEAQKTVPTWNYAAVHAFGRPVLIEDEARLREIVLELVDTHEPPPAPAWDVRKHLDELERELPGIVGFEMEIARLEGKYKFNQNRSRADQEGVIRALEFSEDPLSRQVAGIMRRNLETPEAPDA